MNKIVVEPFRYSESGLPVEWHITAITEAGGSASKTARRNARKKACAALGAAFWYKNPPTQEQVDAAMAEAQS